ncbi:carbonic anhydrase family protein [Hyphomicrobium sp. ghe19]|uniref:carbonic anhydrase family protein n=1 Tax=Hyphomicrobium sp. ghe19 TaxID=2682968 RepID=UPI001367780E|nr:Carbonic anhydrase 2 [Hyphomicrobium sp. ghe19]
MFSRRQFCRSGAIAASLLTLDRAFAAGQCEAFTKARQAAITPDEALAGLKAGNQRFVSGKTLNCNLLKQVHATATGQYPASIVIGCIDSRVPPELVFDQRIGDIFSARVAGNVVNDDIIGSSEFATKLAGAKLIVVLGHSECGAVKGAIDGAKLGMLTELLAKIAPAVDANKDAPGEHTAKNDDFVQRVAISNAKLGAENLTKKGSVLADLVSANELKIVSAMHDIASGRVTFLD